MIKAKEVLLDNLAIFEDRLNLLITDLRADVYTRNSWYII